MIYRKIPKISPSMYKPLRIEAPQIGNAKIPPIISPSEYKPRGLVFGNYPRILLFDSDEGDLETTDSEKTDEERYELS